MGKRNYCFRKYRFSSILIFRGGNEQKSISFIMNCLLTGLSRSIRNGDKAICQPNYLGEEQ